MRKFGAYLLANNRRAGIAALLFALTPMMMIPLGFVSSVIVGLTTLRKGYKAGLSVLMFVILPAVSLIISKHFHLLEAYVMILIQALLVWVFALILIRTRSWKWMLEISVLVAVVGIVLIHVFVPNVKEMWLNLMNQYFHSKEWTSMVRMANVTQEEIVSYAPIATGVIALVSLFGTFIMLLLARWWETTLLQPGLMVREFVRIRIDRIASLVLLVASLGLYWRWPWLLDLYPVLLFPFVIAGLSLLHSLVVWRKQILFLVIVVYITMMLGPVAKYIWLSLAVIGFIDSWYNIRRHYLT